MEYSYSDFRKNLNQIIKLNTKNKLIEVNDKLQMNTLGVTLGKTIDLSQVTPKAFTSNIHSVYSKIELQCVDYTNSAATKTATFNVDPSDIKAMFEEYKRRNAALSLNNIFIPLYCRFLSILAGMAEKLLNQKTFTPHFKEIVTKLEEHTNNEQAKNILYSYEKINPYAADEKGNSSVQKLKITYEPTLRLKWKIYIENGKGKVGSVPTGGIICKKGTYKKDEGVDILISDEQMMKILLISSDYIKHWEVCNMKAFLNNREKVEYYLKTLIQKEKESSIAHPA
jgi:hypothetical protein